MRKPMTKDDYWYQRISDSQPKKIYRQCPCCGMTVGIPEMYDTRFCYMCKSTIYVDETRNEQERRKYKFLKELEKKGIKTNDKKNTKKKKL